MREYGLRAGLDADIIDAFTSVVRAMDHAYIGWLAEQAERDREQRRREAKSRSRRR